MSMIAFQVEDPSPLAVPSPGISLVTFFYKLLTPPSYSTRYLNALLFFLIFIFHYANQGQILSLKIKSHK